jgi:hypothetical protein
VVVCVCVCVCVCVFCVCVCEREGKMDQNGGRGDVNKPVCLPVCVSFPFVYVSV